MLRNKRLIAILLVLLLSACKVGENYQSPKLALPEKWLVSSVDKKAEIEQNWWKNFNDPVLDSLINKALAGNIDLKIATSRIAQARANAGFAKADLLPTTNIDASSNRQANRLAFGNIPFDLTKKFDTYQTGFDASWELDLFGGKKRELEAQKALLKSSEYSQKDLQVSLLAEVARNYIDIRNYQTQLITANDIVTTNERTVKIAQERFSKGETSEPIVITNKNSLSQAKTQIIYYQNLLTQTEYNMDILLGENAGATHLIVQSIKPTPVADKKLLIAAPAQIIANRPDVRVAEQKFAASVAEKGVAIAKLYPDISLTAFLGFLSGDTNNLMTIGNKSWSFGGNVIFPILNYNRISQNIALAKAESEESALLYRKAVLLALIDVENSLNNYNKSLATKDLLEAETKGNAHAVDIAEERYKVGVANFSDVLEARRVYLASKSQLDDASATVSKNLISVYKSLGGGWK